MQRSEGVGLRSARILAELVVIIVGVLLALAADRWNQARSARASEASYLERFAEEIQEDSARAAYYLERRPSLIAGLDSLIYFVDGADAPPNLVTTLISVSSELSLLPPVAWTEIQATNSLDVIRDPDIRGALTGYYATRDRLQLMWRRQDSRARDPFWDQLYGMGLFDPKSSFEAPPSQGLEEFRAWPDMRRLLLALGAGHYFQENNAERTLEATSVALAALRAAN
jgi:hypothetical protein